jgi:hypothetical protein
MNEHIYFIDQKRLFNLLVERNRVGGGRVRCACGARRTRAVRGGRVRCAAGACGARRARAVRGKKVVS